MTTDAAAISTADPAEIEEAPQAAPDESAAAPEEAPIEPEEPEAGTEAESPAEPPPPPPEEPAIEAPPEMPIEPEARAFTAPATVYVTDFRYRPPGTDPFGSLEAIMSDGTFVTIDRNAALNLINPNDLLQYVEGLITAAGAGTHTLTVPIPAGATVRDLTVSPDVAWDSGTSAALNVGEVGGDIDSYVAAVDMKTQTAEISNILSSTGTGDHAGTEVRYAAAASIAFVIVAVGVGSAGRTRCRVYYSVPSAVLAAVKT